MDESDIKRIFAQAKRDETGKVKVIVLETGDGWMFPGGRRMRPLRR